MNDLNEIGYVPSGGLPHRNGGQEASAPEIQLVRRTGIMHLDGRYTGHKGSGAQGDDTLNAQGNIVTGLSRSAEAIFLQDRPAPGPAERSPSRQQAKTKTINPIP